MKKSYIRIYKDIAFMLDTGITKWFVWGSCWFVFVLGTPTKSRRCPSNGSDTARLTDSSNLHSDQYLGENTEDPSGYMEPALTCVDEREFNLNFDFDLSTMENSVMDMDCSRRVANSTKYSNKACEMSPTPPPTTPQKENGGSWYLWW